MGEKVIQGLCYLFTFTFYVPIYIYMYRERKRERERERERGRFKVGAFRMYPNSYTWSPNFNIS